ncbi:hypothetical protein M406DRAFT_35958 [Cryphonectria parasitica EP155]|uniref:Peptidyl-prolyl cis-trans isomerase n=1 Tax=Cryphonectria parasitica (strain ATCC 38755 / EP155) TaxID=660469 RepID=A0A9P4YC36_CRYP1|nr:uncharacterized protein M406DRAFT_35958 [Cryphonectria parasitica EP155]KAF3770142.1 hypothetical protein M406DRAFT_35958 [Cryphonectria parasitica EP155]
MGKNKNADKATAGGGAKGAKGKADKEAGSGKKNGLKIKIRHVLCEKKSRMDEALAKLEEGVSFAEVARNYSEDKAKQGGSLGEVTKDAPFDQKFKDCAWDLEPSTVDKPKYNWVKTDFGYHIIMVEK